VRRWVIRAGAAGGVLCALLAALLFVLGIPLVGAAHPSYPTFATVTLLLFTLCCFLVAAVVAARSREPIAIYAAAMSVMLGATARTALGTCARRSPTSPARPAP
jgi:hypothetical protein